MVCLWVVPGGERGELQFSSVSLLKKPSCCLYGLSFVKFLCHSMIFQQQMVLELENTVEFTQLRAVSHSRIPPHPGVTQKRIRVLQGLKWWEQQSRVGRCSIGLTVTNGRSLQGKQDVYVDDSVDTHRQPDTLSHCILIPWHYEFCEPMASRILIQSREKPRKPNLNELKLSLPPSSIKTHKIN